jgi:PTS system N-acetylgalactosamine-specific IIA component
MSNDNASARALIVAHGELAAGLVSAVERISGRGSALDSVSNQGMSAEEMEALLRDRIENNGLRAIFTDLPGGSWTIAARRAMRGRDDVTIVTGVNLAALLEFVMRDDLQPTAAAAGSVVRARSAITVFGGGGTNAA